MIMRAARVCVQLCTAGERTGAVTVSSDHTVGSLAGTGACTAARVVGVRVVGVPCGAGV